MAKDIIHMNLRFSVEKHAKLVKKKKEIGASSWEDYLEKVSGIDKEE